MSMQTYHVRRTVHRCIVIGGTEKVVHSTDSVLSSSIKLQLFTRSIGFGCRILASSQSIQPKTTTTSTKAERRRHGNASAQPKKDGRVAVVIR